MVTPEREMAQEIERLWKEAQNEENRRIREAVARFKAMGEPATNRAGSPARKATSRAKRSR